MSIGGFDCDGLLSLSNCKFTLYSSFDNNSYLFCFTCFYKLFLSYLRVTGGSDIAGSALVPFNFFFFNCKLFDFYLS